MLYNLDNLSYQMEWRGPRLASTGAKVCRHCTDKPFAHNRPVILPPDPAARRDPRPEDFDAEMGEIVFGRGNTRKIHGTLIARLGSASLLSGVTQNTKLEDVTITSTGTLGTHATLTATLTNAQVAALGGAALSGQLSKTLGNVSLAAASLNALNATLSVTLSGLQLSALGYLEKDGTLAATLDDLSFAATGIRDVTLPDITGELTATLDDIQITSSSTLGTSAVLTATLSNVSLSADADLVLQAQLAKTLAALSVSADGTVALNAQLAQALGDLGFSGAGFHAIAGQLSQTLADMDFLGVSGHAITGQLAKTLENLQVSGFGGHAITGQLSRILGIAQLNAVGSHANHGQLTASLGNLQVSAFGSHGTGAVLTATLGNVRVAGVGRLANTGLLTRTFANASIFATGTNAAAPPLGQIVTTSVANTSSQIMTTPFVQFFHGFKQGDLANGSLLRITDDLGGVAAYTAARRADWPAASTNRSGADLTCKLVNNIPAKIGITSLSRVGTTATATTASAHGLTTGAKVLVQPVNTDIVVGNTNAYYCGLVTATVTGVSTFTYTVLGIAPGGSSTVPMEMCYTRILGLEAIAGSWNDTLPAGKTSTNILTDLQANFDNVILELTDLKDASGATVGSGTYAANFFTTIAQAGTDKLRVTATGPTMCDFTGIMKFADTIGGARHATLAGWFYVTALLNPATGAVMEVNARAFVDQSLTRVAMSYYTFRVRMKLGSTIVRSIGLSSNSAIDGKLQTFAPTAVNLVTNVITIPNHGFKGNERVQFSSTGVLPAPLVANKNYAIVRTDQNTITISGPNPSAAAVAAGDVSYFDETNMNGRAYFGNLPMTAQGSGIHTITCWQQSSYATRQVVSAIDGRPDRWTGNTGAFANWQYHVIHDKNYLQRSKLVPPVALSLNMTYPVAETSNAGANTAYIKVPFVFGSPGILQNDQDSGGSGRYHEYGAPFTDIPSRRVRHCSDLGYAQTLRVSALSLGCFDAIYTGDDVTWRPAVVNNGPTRTGDTYPGMPSSTPSAQWFRSTTITAPFVHPTNVTHNPGPFPFNQLGPWTNSHRYNLFSPLYLFEGRQEIHDLMLADAMQSLLPTSPVVYTNPGDFVTARIFSIAGTRYYSGIPYEQARGDAATMSVLTFATVLGDPLAPERPVVKAYLDDTLTAMDYLINTQGSSVDPNWTNWGTFQMHNVSPRGPGSLGDDHISTFFEGVCGIHYSNAYRLYPSAKWQAISGHMSKSFSVFYESLNNSWASNSYQTRVLIQSGASTGKFMASYTEPMMLDQNLDGILYMTDGTVWGMFNNQFVPVTPPIAGEIHQPTKLSYSNAATFFTTIPPEVTLYNNYYVRQPSGSYAGWKYATTNSDATIIPSYSARVNATSPTNITTTTTSITTSVAMTNMQSGLIVLRSAAGKEICKVTAGANTTSVTIQRALYGSVALNHGVGAVVYVPHVGGGWVNFQARDIPYPPTGHGLRTPGSANAPQFGYRTMLRAACGAWYVNGKLSVTPFTNANKWFADPTDNPFSAANSLLHSVDIGLAEPPIGNPPVAPVGFFWKGDPANGYTDFDTHETWQNVLVNDPYFGNNVHATAIIQQASDATPWSGSIYRMIVANTQANGTTFPSGSLSGTTINVWEPGSYTNAWEQSGHTTWFHGSFLIPNGTDPRYLGKLTPVSGDGVGSPFHVLMEWHINDSWFASHGGTPNTSTKLEIGWNDNYGPALIFKPVGGLAGSVRYSYFFETNQTQTKANDLVNGGSGPTGTVQPLRYNHWYDILVKMVLSSDPAVGYIEWYVDGNLRFQDNIATLVQATDLTTPGISFQAGMYRNYPTYGGNVTSTTNANEHIYVGPMVTGPTRISVTGT